VRLSIDEVKKQYDGIKKLYAQGLAVAPVDVKQVLDLYDTIEALQADNEQLQARAAQYRDALIIANNYMPDIGHFCTCGKCKRCGTDITYAGYGHCLKCARNIIDAALSDTSADYHNPADVEALIMAMEAIKAAWSDRSVNAALDKASEALTKISKALEVRE